jgi:ubiquinone/menaquinone biosynthesis C-methylase UbiE
MSKLTSEEWSSLWTRDTVTTLSSMFPNNYDLTVADFWQEVVAGDHDRVIDLACGNGALAWLANDFLNKTRNRTTVTGIDAADIDPFKTLQKDRKDFPMVEFISNTPIEKLPFEDSSVDVAISQYGLEYSDLQRSIPELSRILKPSAKMGFIVHSEQSSIVKGSTRYLEEHKTILNDIRIHDLFLELDALIGKRRDWNKISSMPKIRKKLIAINTASDSIKQIMRVVDPESEIKRYCVPIFDAFTEVSVRNRVNRKKIINTSINGLQKYINRIEDLKTSTLSAKELASLVALIEKEDFTITENRPMAYKENDNIGIALVACR